MAIFGLSMHGQPTFFELHFFRTLQTIGGTIMNFLLSAMVSISSMAATFPLLGYDIRFTSRCIITDCNHAHAPYFLQTFEPFAGSSGLAGVIAAFYDRDVHDPKQIIDRIDFLIHEQFVRPDVMVLQRLFAMRFMRYLSGVGHPNHPALIKSGMLTEATIAKSQSKRALRAQLLLQAVTDTPSIPLDANWSIVVGSLYYASFQWPCLMS